MPGASRLTDMTVGIGSHQLPCCLLPDTKVVTDHGIIDIKDYKDGLKLLTRDGFFQPEYYHNHDYEGPVIDMGVHYYHDNISVTADHKFLATKKIKCPIDKNLCRGGFADKCEGCERETRHEAKNLEWVEAQDLTKEYFLVHPISNDIFEPENFILDPRFYLYGMYLGDGFIHSDNIFKYTLNINEIETQKKIYNCLIECGMELHRRDEQGRNGEKSWCNMFVHNAEFVAELDRLFGRGSLTKFIHPDIFKCTTNQIYSLILGWFDSDGNKNWDKYIATSSKKAAYDLQELLFSIGLPSGLSKYKNHSPKTKEYTSDQYRVTVPPDARMGTNYFHHSFIYDNLVYIPIKNISKRNYSGKVYNFTMPDGVKSEYCSNVLVSNCPHQILSVRITGSPDTHTNSLMHSRATMDLATHTCPHCLSPTTKLLTDKGFIEASKISSLVKLYNNDGGYYVVQFHRREYEGGIVSIKLNNIDDRIELTEDHRIYVYSNGKIFLSKVKNIQPSDYMIIPAKYKQMFKDNGINLGIFENIGDYYIVSIEKIIRKNYKGLVYNYTMNKNTDDEYITIGGLIKNCPVNMCITGSHDVIVNNLNSHRLGDVVTEFCGIGNTVSASGDHFND